MKEFSFTIYQDGVVMDEGVTVKAETWLTATDRILSLARRLYGAGVECIGREIGVAYLRAN